MNIYLFLVFWNIVLIDLLKAFIPIQTILEHYTTVLLLDHIENMS